MVHSYKVLCESLVQGTVSRGTADSPAISAMASGKNIAKTVHEELEKVDNVSPQLCRAIEG